MSTTPPEPPEGQQPGYQPPPDFSTPPPPAGYGAPPPTYGSAPQPGYGAPAPMAGAYGPGSPGNLLDRFLARLIDGVLVGIVYGILSAIFSAILVGSTTYNVNTGEFHTPSYVLYHIVNAIIGTAIILGYFVFMEVNMGATLGKMALKLNVVGPDGVSKPTYEQSVRRNIWLAAGVLGILGTLGSLLGGLLEIVAVIMIAIGINSDPVKRQAWHDKFASGTGVLKHA